DDLVTGVQTCALPISPYGRQNEIVIDFADPGAIKLYFLSKVPGAELSLGNAEMAFYYKDSFAASHMLEGYEHLILMAMVGDQSRSEERRGGKAFMIEW